jgi:hypothetical protein
MLGGGGGLCHLPQRRRQITLPRDLHVPELEPARDRAKLLGSAARDLVAGVRLTMRREHAQAIRRVGPP